MTQRFCHRKRSPGRDRCPWSCLGGWVLPAGLLVLLVLGVRPALAAFSFTPFVRAEMGYDDNVHLQRVARSDFFFAVKPGASLAWQEPTSKVTLRGDLRYVEYYRLSEFTQVDSGNASLSWDYEPSRRWKLRLYDAFSATYDVPQFDDEGRLVAVRADLGRRDRNTLGLAVQHNFGPQSFLATELRSSYNTYTSDEVEDSQIHQFNLSGGHRLGPDWRAEAKGYWFYNDYQRSVDISNRGGSFSLVRMLGPTKDAMLTLGYSEVRANTDNPEVRSARDYETYRAGVTFVHRVSPTFRWDASLGWAQVEGSQEANQAAGHGYPTFTANLAWSGQRWRLAGFAYTSLGEQELVGENLGLTLSHGVGFTFAYDLAKRWRLVLNASYLRNDYKQDPRLAGLQPDQDTESILAGLLLSWRLTRRMSLALDYRYLIRDAENDDDDRSQNRVMLILTYEHPYRW